MNGKRKGLRRGDCGGESRWDMKPNRNNGLMERKGQLHWFHVDLFIISQDVYDRLFCLQRRLKWDTGCQNIFTKKKYIYICKSNFLLLFMWGFFFYFFFFYEKPWLDSCHVNSQWKYQHLRDYNDLILGDIKKVANKDFSLTHLECKDNFIIPFFSISRKLFFKTSNYIIWLSCRF